MPPTRPRATADADAFAAAVFGGRPFVAAAALQAGIISNHELRTHFTRVLPGIHLATGSTYDPLARVRAAWLWAPRGAVVAGDAAALLHGERQVAPGEIGRGIDLYLTRAARAPEGIRIRSIRRALESADVTEESSMRCTSVCRTALDLARWHSDPLQATIAVDAICNVSRTPVAQVADYADATPGLHGTKHALRILARSDHRADSPRETILRLILRDSPLPGPEPQVAIADSAGRHIVTADLAYREHRVALLYDGEHHLRREQRDWDSTVTARLFDEGWLSLRITSGMLRDRETLVRRTAEMLRRQGWTGD